jgi:predicted PurR-regulated permease PerM
MSENATPRRSPRRAVQWTILVAATSFVVYWCLLILSPFISVIAWAGVLSIAFYPLHQELVSKTGRVSLSALMCCILAVVAILIPLAFITGLAIDQFVALRGYLQETFKDGFELGRFPALQTAYDWAVRRFGFEVTQVTDWIAQHATELSSAAAGYSLAFAANVSGLVVSFVFTIFAMFLLIRDGDRIVERIPGLLPFTPAQSEAMLLRIRDVIYASVYGVLVIAAIQGVLCGLMFWVLGIPSALLWGVLTVLTSVLPLVGSAAVWGPGVVYLLLTGQWPQAIILAVWGTVAISAVDNFLRPKLVGGRVGLSELVMFFALLGGLQVFGILGIVIGPVLFAIAGSILDVLTDVETEPEPAPPATQG